MDDLELTRIVEDLTVGTEEQHTLQEVVDQAVATVPGCDMCSVFVRRDRQLIDVGATTDSLARRIDDLQFELDEGPCLTVVHDHEVAFVPETRSESRWSRWGSAAADEGVRSSLSIRLATADPYLACLNMYSRQPHSFDDDARDLAFVYARLASVAVLQSREITGLRTALHNRMVIGAAQGVLMERYGLSLDRAFEVLRRQSNESNTKLSDVAQSVVETVASRGPS